MIIHYLVNDRFFFDNNTEESENIRGILYIVANLSGFCVLLYFHMWFKMHKFEGTLRKKSR